MKNLLNFTGRQDNIRKVGSNPEIKIIVKEENGVTQYEPIINFDKDREFPPDSKIFIQAYSNGGYVGQPVEFGTVTKPDNRTINDFEVGKDEIRFRLKVISATGKIKKVLATCYQISPWGSTTLLIIGTRDQDCLIEYEINPNDAPILYFKKGYGLERDIEQSFYLKALHFNNAIREILKTYILEEELFTDCKIRKGWVENFEKLTGDNFPEKSTDPIKIKDFINKSIKKFLEEKKPNLDGKSLIEVIPDSSILIKDKLLFKSGV